MEAEKARGTPYCYRYRVPKHKDVVINDSVRGKVTFSTDTLGDFVIMRSNGLPVYNFCVAVDDALMKITHVIRADEHLPNTLRQVRCTYSAEHCPPLSPSHDAMSGLFAMAQAATSSTSGYQPSPFPLCEVPVNSKGLS